MVKTNREKRRELDLRRKGWVIVQRHSAADCELVSSLLGTNKINFLLSKSSALWYGKEETGEEPRALFTSRTGFVHLERVSREDSIQGLVARNGAARGPVLGVSSAGQGHLDPRLLA